MPQQEGGHPAGAPCNISPSSTSGKPSPQPGGITKASPRNPLKNIANYRSTGWRKDLDHILGYFYHYNYPSCKEEEWKKLRTKFLEYLGKCQEEWRTIKEDNLLQYMPYMESCFHTLTGIRLEGLSQFTGWIKPGSYYHGVVARKGQITGACTWQEPSHPRDCRSALARVVWSPIKRRRPPQPVPLHWERKVVCLKGHALTHPCRWRQVEQGVASPGWNRRRPALRKNGGWADPQSITGHHLGNGKVSLPIPYHSKIAREGMRQYSSSTGMQVSAHWPITMWLPREWPATTLIWSQVQQRASTTRYSA